MITPNLNSQGKTEFNKARMTRGKPITIPKKIPNLIQGERTKHYVIQKILLRIWLFKTKKQNKWKKWT